MAETKGQRMTETTYAIDLDPEETEDIARVIERARETNTYLHIELRSAADA